MKLVLLLFLLFILLYPFWVVHKQTLGSKEKIEKRPSEWTAEYEDIYYKTDDGVLLKGWWIPAKSNKAVLLLHGNGGSRNGYHSGIFELGKIYHSRGFNVMMVDLRAHGESGGKRVYFGVKEHKDMLGWIDKIDPDKHYNWHLHGFSMGGAIALMMVDSKPNYFKKVIVDAPWIDFEKLVKQELKRRASIPAFAYGYIEWIATTFFDQNFKEADNKLRCKRLCGKEIVYIFEENDKLQPVYQREILRKICPDVNFILFNDVGHVDAFKTYPERYTQVLKKEGF